MHTKKTTVVLGTKGIYLTCIDSIIKYYNNNNIYIGLVCSERNSGKM